MPLSVLVIDREPPVSARQGNSLIAKEVMRRLAHHHLVLVAPATPTRRDETEELGDTFSEVHLVPRAAWTPAISGYLEAALMHRVKKAPATDLTAARSIHDALRRVASMQRFDVIHARQLPMAGYAESVNGPGKLLELIDSETLGAERSRPRTLRARARAAASAQVERRAVRGYDVVTTVADADAARLRDLAPNARVEVVPNGVDTEFFLPQPSVPREPGSLVFVGAMSFGPNVAAMHWFCHEVLPAVRSRRPGVRLTIVGRDPAPAVRRLAAIRDVEVTGEVADVRPYLARGAVFIAPMISGSGIKNKVLEAMAMGTPVVCTPLAVEGLQVQRGKDALVAADTAEMADVLVRVLDDTGLRAAVGQAGRTLVEQRYSWDACAETYERLWYELASLGRSR